jgi:subtilisin family serine protease
MSGPAIQFDPALKELLLRRTGDPLGRFTSEEAGSQEVAVVARLVDPSAQVESLKYVSHFGEVVTGRVRLDQMVKVRRDPKIASLKAAKLHRPSLAVSVPEIQASAETLRRAIGEDVTGRGVVLGFLDWGFDFAHLDFRTKQGDTRLLYLWDQRGGTLPESPEPYGYGRELTAEMINRALSFPDPYTALGYDFADADRAGVGTHATHVAGIAAGNGFAPGSAPGVAPEAYLIFVHLRGDDTNLEDNLGDSVRILEAVRYIVDRAGDRPVVINISLGSTGGPHDASPLVVQALDSLLDEKPGVAIVMSCGNYFESDLHSSGVVETGNYVDLKWHATPRNDEICEMEVWYPGEDVLSVELIDPSGKSIARVQLGEDYVARDGDRILASIYNRLDDPNNGLNHIDIFLWPDAMIGVWTVRLHGELIVDGRYHGWIEREEPGAQSRFSPDCATPVTTNGTICNGYRTIAVGAYDARVPSHPIVPFSSSGPTRDLRPKPDISAPGAGIRSARSSTPRMGFREMNGQTVKSGTSMASPHVAGVVALMFQLVAERRLHAEDTRRILMETARASPPFNESDRLRYGAGRVDAAAAVRAVKVLNQRIEATAGVDMSKDRDITDHDVYSILPELLVEYGDKELRRTDEYGVPVYDKRQQLVFAPTGRTYSFTRDQFNYHAANFVYNTAYKVGYEVPVFPPCSESALDARSYNNTADTFKSLAGSRPKELEYFSRFFEVVARPGQAEPFDLRQADLILCGPGAGIEFGQIAIIVDPTLRDMADPLFAGRDSSQGKGVQCIEAGLSIHTRYHRYGKVLTDGLGKVLPTRMVVRFKASTIDLGRVAEQVNSDPSFRRLLAGALWGAGIPRYVESIADERSREAEASGSSLDATCGAEINRDLENSSSLYQRFHEIEADVLSEFEWTDDDSQHTVQNVVLDRNDDRDYFDVETEGQEDDTNTAPELDTNSVNVILDQPGESDDKFQLISSDGSYTRTLSAIDAKLLTNGEKFLRFDGIDPKKSYRLIHRRSTKSELRLPEMAFKYLTEAGRPPLVAKSTYLTLPSQVSRKLPDKYGIDQTVDEDLVEISPVLVDLDVEDPEV